MSEFAQIDDNGVVINVVVVPDSVTPGPPSPTTEAAGQEYLTQNLRLPGTWLQAGLPERNRGAYPSVGNIYHADSDVFSAPQPFPSWSWDSVEAQWTPPIPYPEDDNVYVWDEQEQQWIQRPNQLPPSPPPTV